MKINLFENFKIKKFCKKYDIKNYTINKEGSVDVNDNVLLPQRGIDKLPFKFRKITFSFDLFNNYLKNLNNCAIHVGRNFYCSGNQLTTLLGGPNYVGENYFCQNNILKDVYGFPETFSGSLEIHGNPVCEILYLIAEGAIPGGPTIINRQVRFIKLLNEYKVIRNGNTIIQDRLEEAIDGLGIKLPDLSNKTFLHYKLI